MRKSRFVLLTLLLLVVWTLATDPPAAAAATSTHGEPIAVDEPLTLATVIADPDAYAGKKVVVEGKVRRACEAKGCWLELAPTAEKGTQGCRVTFKDYGFFVPLDSAGATARVEGVINVRQVPPEEVAHLEGEGAFFAHKAADGSAQELQIVASGVELSRD
jgi:hypothetical protein